MSYQTLLVNRTPFSADKFVIPDKDGQEVSLIVVVAAFEAMSLGRPLRLAELQPPVRVVDEHYGDPASSSMRYESSVALGKPLVDLLLNAHAYAPGEKPARRVAVEIRAGDIHKILIVQGDRNWKIGPLGRQASQPSQFLKIPIIYERAFGGKCTLQDDQERQRTDPRNPVGLGFRGALSHDPEIRTQVPNIEYPQERMESLRDQPPPAGFGAISRNWKPRLDFAGTYDSVWLNEKWPLLPSDFDLRFNQTAPVDQQSRTLRGGEMVELRNLTPEGEWRFKLPTLDIPVHLLYEDHSSRAELRLDTILIEPDLYGVTLTSRLHIRVTPNQLVLREIVLGHVLRGWLRARMAGKTYVDRKGTDGLDPGGRNFRT